MGVFIPILLNGAGYVTRMMLTELATDTAVSLLEKLSNRKQFLGIDGKGVDDFVKSKLENVNEAVGVQDKTTLDFMMSFFPVDIDFDYLSKFDVKINNWDNITSPLKEEEGDEISLDFVCFTGNNPVFENALLNMESMFKGLDDHPKIGKELLPVAQKIWKMRNALAKAGLKILAHSNDNDLSLCIYNPEEIRDHKNELEPYLKGEGYPFGALFSMIKISSSISSRKVGLVENGFINGNVNSTYDMIKAELKVAPPMKAMIDDSYRQQILRDETRKLAYQDEYGYVVDPNNSLRLPNVTDYMFIPSAIMDAVESLHDNVLSHTRAGKDGLVNIVARYVKAKTLSRFAGHVDKSSMRQGMTEFMNERDSIDYLKLDLENNNIAHTLTGVSLFFNSWKKTYEKMANAGGAELRLLNSLIVDLGYEGYGSNPVRPWLSGFVKRMDNHQFTVNESKPNKMSNFLKGLAKVVRDLEISNVFLTDNLESVNVIDDFVEDYARKSSYDLSSKTVVKNKKLRILRKVLGVMLDTMKTSGEGISETETLDEEQRDFGTNKAPEKILKNISNEYKNSSSFDNVAESSSILLDVLNAK